jgi:hypothetical protein
MAAFVVFIRGRPPAVCTAAAEVVAVACAIHEGLGELGEGRTLRGPIDMRAQAEVLSARRADTAPSAVASGFKSPRGRLNLTKTFFAGERLSPSARERVRKGESP